MNSVDFARYVAFILKNFPQSRIVFLTRNAEKVAASGWFKKLPASQVIADIKATDRRFSETCKKHQACFLIDHRDVTENGVRLGELFKFLGVAHDRKNITKVLSIPLTHMKASRLPKKPIKRILWHLGVRPSARRRNK